MLGRLIRLAVLGLWFCGVAYGADRPVIPAGGRSMLADDGISGFKASFADRALGRSEAIEVEGMPFERAIRITTMPPSALVVES